MYAGKKSERQEYVCMAEVESGILFCSLKGTKPKLNEAKQLLEFVGLDVSGYHKDCASIIVAKPKR